MSPPPSPQLKPLPGPTTMPSPPPPPPPLPSSPASLYCVDQRTWRVCAGACVRIPPLHSRVFYFPQGHLEQQSSSASPASVLPPSGSLLRHQDFVGRAVLPCVVSSVDFMADSCTDEVFVKFRLRPDNGGGGGATRGSDFQGGGSAFEDKVLTYAKTLTPSDANNGGGFSVPRYCADFIFPKLNFAVDPPVQVLAVQDVNGTVWNFRHIYRGTPRRHLLTTGWSKFVNSKKLVAGDTVIFMRDPECTTDEMSVGIRRASRAGGMAQCARWRQMIGGGGNVSSNIEEGSPNGLLGASKGKEEEVVRAMEQWMSREEFEVVYHPTRIGGVGTVAEFVIAREAVEEAAGTFWGGGMRVKMALEAEDCSRITFLQGTVSGVEIPKDGTWRGSPWRMLQIMWDEPDVMKDKKFVSPWQVEAVAHVTPLHPAFHPLKKLRCPLKSGSQTDGDIDSLYPWTGYGNMPSGNLIPQSVIYNSPFGMQGSRQDESRAFGLFHYVNGNAPMRLDSFIGNMLPKLDTISIDLNKGSSQFEMVSTVSPTDGVHPSHGERVHRGAKAAKVNGAGNGSIQLFGQIIHPKNPVEDPLAEATAKEINGLKGPSGVGPECGNPLLDLSLLTCLNGLNNGIVAEAQMLNHVVL